MRTPFKKRLHALGFASYEAYLASPLWTRIREFYRRSGLPTKCLACGESKYELHHRTYERLGKERASDFVALCRDCHHKVHDRIDAGRGSLEGTHLVLAEIHGWTKAQTIEKFDGYEDITGKKRVVLRPPSPARKPTEDLVENSAAPQVQGVKPRALRLTKADRKAARERDAVFLAARIAPQELAKAEKNRQQCDARAKARRRQKISNPVIFKSAAAEVDPDVVYLKNVDGTVRIWNRKPTA